jgi:hypothetical protein
VSQPTNSSLSGLLPTPCLNCGGPMSLLPAPYLHSELTLACPYCGQKEGLPSDVSAQQRQLRLRLMQVQQAREATEAPLKVMETIRKHWLIALIPLVLISVSQLGQVATLSSAVPIQSAAMMVIFGSVGLGMVAGYVGMMRCFRRLVRPLLHARPPLQQGLQARCRTCGGELPAIREFEVNCGFCNTKNLLGQMMSADVNQMLTAERMEYQQRTNKTWNSGVYALPMQTFYRWTVAAVVSISAIGIGILCIIR